MKKLKYIAIGLLFTVSGCEYEFPEVPQPQAGTANFAKYIAVGNSLTAGFMDGALYDRGQKNSFAVILAEQMKAVGGGEFNVPDINSVNGFYGMAGNVILGRLKLNAQATPAPTVPGDVPTPYSGDKTKLNNFGVPGVTLLTAQIKQTGGPASPENKAYNPLYARFASAPGESTLIDDAKAALANGGTFFTMWLGNNDVVGYAIRGASDPTLLTSPADFATRYNALLNKLLEVPNVNGAIANIPNIADLPYFRTIPYNPITLTQAQADQLNAGYAMFNGGVSLYNSNPLVPESLKRPQIKFVAGKNALVIEDEDLSTVPGLPKYRMLNATEFVTLSIPQADLAKGMGTQTAVPDQYILTTNEINEITKAVVDFNAIILASATAASARVALVDINQAFVEVAKGNYSLNGITFTAALAPPYGGFSLDGIHPNARGNAFIPNTFIEAINTKFGATIPTVNPNNYPGNDLPQ